MLKQTQIEFEEETKEGLEFEDVELEMDSAPPQKKTKKVTKNKEGFAKVEDGVENS